MLMARGNISVRIDKGMVTDMAVIGNENLTHRLKILLIGNDYKKLQPLIENLECQEISALFACDAATGLSMKERLNPNIVLLEIRLNNVNILDFAAQLNKQRACGVIVLCDAGDNAQLEACLDLGADDYLLLPASAWDVVARVRAVHRRASQPARAVASDPGSTLTIGPICINTWHRSVHTLDGRRVSLTSAEYTTLETLAYADGQAVSRDRLSEAALRRPWRVEDRSVDQLVFNLRQKLPSNTDRGSLIHSIRGSGYWMRAPDRPARAPIDFAAFGHASAASAMVDVDRARIA